MVAGQPTVFTVSMDTVTDFKQLSVDDTTETSGDEPWLMKSLPTALQILSGIPTRLNMLVFKAGFAKSGSASDYKMMNKAEAVRASLLGSSRLKMASLGLDDHPGLNPTHVFGYSSSYRKLGTNLHSAASLRLLGEKSSELFLIS